jgi:hypothetical protein
MGKRPDSDKEFQETAATEIYRTARAEADSELAMMKNNLQGVHDSALKTGRMQAFRAMQLLAEFMEMKQLALMIDSKEYLKIPGVKSAEDYLETQGLSRRTGFNQLKIARTLAAEEVQLLCTLGFTRRDLLGYASLPEDKRLEIKEGKVINLETASREDIRDLIEQVVAETRAVKEETDADLRAKEKVLKDKESVINKQAKALARFEQQAELKGLSPEEDAFMKRVEAHRICAQGSLMALEPEELRAVFPEELSRRSRAFVISAACNLKMQVLALLDTVTIELGDATMNPEVMEDFERWQKENGFTD